MLTKETNEAILQELSKKMAGAACPICQNKAFNLADGYFLNTLQADFNALSLGGPSIPTVAAICTNCGFVSQHAIGVLGLLPKEAEGELS